MKNLNFYVGPKVKIYLTYYFTLDPTAKFRFFILYSLSLDHSKTVFFYDKIVANDG